MVIVGMGFLSGLWLGICKSSPSVHNFFIELTMKCRWNHKLLNTLKDGLSWKMIRGSSDVYIKTLLKTYPPERILLRTPVRAVGNDGHGVWIQTDTWKEYFDNVILTTSAPIALDLIRGGATKAELEILGAFRTAPNVVVLHTDESVCSPPQTLCRIWLIY